MKYAREAYGVRMASTRDGEPAPAEVVRLSINLHPEVAATLKVIAGRHGLTITDTIRRAIAVLDYMDRETSTGATLCVQRGDHLCEVKLIWG
jgi:hypothetical protein